MNKTGKALLTFAAIAATVSLGTNALLWNRYTPEREILRFSGGRITRGAYQTALESADASGDTLNNLLLSNTYDPMMRRNDPAIREGTFEPVANPVKTGSSLLGKTLRVADADVPVVNRRRAVRRSRIVRSCTPTRSVVRGASVRGTTVSRVAGVVVRPTGNPVSAMDTSTVRGRLRPSLERLPTLADSNNAIGGGIGNAPQLSFAGPGVVEPTGVVASYPVNAPGATVFSQIGSGVTGSPIAAGATGTTLGAGAAGTTLGAISPVALGATALLGAVVANNAISTTNGVGTTGGVTGGATTAGVTTGGTTSGNATGGTPNGNDPDVPAVPEPAPVALVATTMLGVAGLMVRARRKSASGTIA